MTIELRPGSGRFVTRAEGRETLHSFSFGAHYEAGNVGFAAMVAHNDEGLPPGTGYGDHPHRDLEIVTWVLDGALRHTDSTGHSTVLGPGSLLRTSAGSGIVHSEVADSGTGTSTRFLQTWLRPDDPGGTPSYQGAEVDPDARGLIELVGPEAPVGVGTRDARLFVVHGSPDGLALPDSPRMHLFVVSGDAGVGDRALVAGDAARLVDEGGRTLVLEETAVVSIWTFG